MSRPVFAIRNLECAYQPERPVLKLPELEIPAGKLVFIIGKSGIGKSTLLETLGLMNRTIVALPDTTLTLSPNASEAIELKNCWSWGNERLSHFRRQHFSFIFQHTNLMPNFTAGENMAINLLAEGKSFAEAKQEVLNVMDQLFLDRDIFDKKVTEISGGQRQRLAFVRAITAQFTILFGDEPTGNLDEATAEKLIAILKDLVNEQGKTIVLVSHNLSLAHKFADLVVPITAMPHQGEHLAGHIALEHVFERHAEGWCQGGGVLVSNPLELLNSYLA
jgi:ABC-type lipoprotein export system ATPase subunit